MIYNKLQECTIAHVICAILNFKKKNSISYGPNAANNTYVVFALKLHTYKYEIDALHI